MSLIDECVGFFFAVVVVDQDVKKKTFGGRFVEIHLLVLQEEGTGSWVGGDVVGRR